MAISCAHCGGRHASPAEVKACWSDAQDRLPLADPTPPAVAGAERVASDPVRARNGGRAAPALGRNAVVGPGGEEPPGWEGALRVTVTAATVADPGALSQMLAAAAADRRPLVVELHPDAAAQLDLPAVEQRPPHRLGPRFTFASERLRGLIWHNAVDARGDPPRFALLDDAVALGATPVVDAAGDVLLADGRRAWLDGGPLRHTPPIDGVPVLHRVAVEHGSLRPFGTGAAPADQLAPDQRAAVVHVGGAARIIAPAGSGKTRVLTERARYLLAGWGMPASAVCLVAFNKRAQEEMRVRTRDLPGLQVRTLNSIALAIVNGTPPFASRPARLRTIDEPAVRAIIGKLVRFPRRRNADPVAPWIEALSLARLGMQDPREVESRYDGEVDGFADVFPRFRLALADQGCLDFDEQLQLAVELLLTEPAVRAAAQRACRLLLVDEFQDLTPLHLLLVRLLAGPDLAVFGVGDDDQTIYGYNGADPAFLIDYAELFPGAGDHPLEVNYRCPEGVVTAVDRLLRHNARRVPKVIRAAHTGARGWAVEEAADPVEATTGIVRRALAGGYEAIDVAVLTRVNSLLAPVQVALAAEGIPVRAGVGPEFAERTAVRSAFAWLRLVCAADGDRLSSADLGEALRRPSRPLHPNVTTWVTEQTSVAGLHRLAGRLNTERDAERVEAFATDIERLRRLVHRGGTTVDVLATLRDSMGLEGSITSLDRQRVGMNRAAQHDDLVAVAQLAALHPEAATFEAWLRAALSRRATDAGVTLATVHRVKGQEWPVVVVHLADSDQFPHRLADDLEEERRLFHVALTRASVQATIVVDETPSPFVRELTEEPGTRPGPSVPRRPVAAQASRPARPGHDLAPADATLFSALRDLRRQLAAGKPAYTVLADAALHEIATLRPTTLADLAAVHGIGPNKLDRYGAAILAVVEDHALAAGR